MKGSTGFDLSNINEGDQICVKPKNSKYWVVCKLREKFEPNGKIHKKDYWSFIVDVTHVIHYLDDDTQGMYYNNEIEKIVKL